MPVMAEAVTPPAEPPPKLKLIVSSTVYGQQGLLDQVFAMLDGYGYEVWMSHAGTIPTNPKRTAFSNCLDAVNKCDAFLGIITGSYGSGVGPNKKSITHREIIRSVAQRKLRWFLVHHDVVVARQLLRQVRFDGTGSRKPLAFHKTPELDDDRELEM